MGTKFTVYDNGVNPQKASSSTLEGGTLRQELAAVCYVSAGSWVSGLQVGCDGQDWLPDLWAVPVGDKLQGGGLSRGGALLGRGAQDLSSL